MVIVILSVIKKLPASVQSLVEPGIRAAATKWGVALPDNFSFDFDSKFSSMGNKPLELSSMKTYPRGIHLGAALEVSSYYKGL